MKLDRIVAFPLILFPAKVNTIMRNKGPTTGDIICLNQKPVAMQADDPHPSSGGTRLCRADKSFR